MGRQGPRSGKQTSSRGGHDGHARDPAGLASPADRAAIRWPRPTGTRPTEKIPRERGSGGAPGGRKPPVGGAANSRSAVQPGAGGGPWHPRRDGSPAWDGAGTRAGAEHQLEGVPEATLGLDRGRGFLPRSKPGRHAAYSDSSFYFSWNCRHARWRLRGWRRVPTDYGWTGSGATSPMQWTAC